MTDELCKLNLRDDFDEALGISDASRWKLEMPGALEVWVTVHSLKSPSELFQARLLWAKYPDLPPSLKFRDRVTGRLDMPQAWPIVRGFRPRSLDACVNYCSEGFALHPEWQIDPRYRWDPSNNPFLRVLRTLQEEMDEHFQGRFK